MRKGSKHTEATRQKISQAQRGRKLSESHKSALLSAWRGQHHSEEAKGRIGQANSKNIDVDRMVALYVGEQKTIKETAVVLGVSPPTVHRNLRLLGLARNTSEARRLSRPPQSVFYLAQKQPGHPRANKRGYVKEHILVWEATHGKPLPHGWVIHHLNGVKNDNRPENLEAMPNGNHCSGLVNRALRKRILVLEGQIRRFESITGTFASYELDDN